MFWNLKSCLRYCTTFCLFFAEVAKVLNKKTGKSQAGKCAFALIYNWRAKICKNGFVSMTKIIGSYFCGFLCCCDLSFLSLVYLCIKDSLRRLKKSLMLLMLILYIVTTPFHWSQFIKLVLLKLFDTFHVNDFFFVKTIRKWWNRFCFFS